MKSRTGCARRLFSWLGLVQTSNKSATFDVPASRRARKLEQSRFQHQLLPETT
jgi:hypothetical protein